jgi:hypothetical protein
MKQIKNAAYTSNLKGTLNKSAYNLGTMTYLCQQETFFLDSSKQNGCSYSIIFPEEVMKHSMPDRKISRTGMIMRE